MTKEGAGEEQIFALEMRDERENEETRVEGCFEESRLEEIRAKKAMTRKPFRSA